MNESALRFRVGLFVLAGLVLLGVMIILFGGFPTFFTPQNTYSVLFRSAPGVESGTPVRRSGITIGEVKSVDLEENGRVRVTIRVNKKYPLLKDDRVTLSQTMLGGDAILDFVPAPDAERDPQAELAEAGTEFVATNRTEVQALLKEAAEVLPTTREAINDIRKSIKRYEQIAPTLEETAKEIRDLAKATREVIPELRKTNDEILVTARNFGKVGERVDVLIQTNQDKVIKVIDNLNDTLVRVSQLFNEENQRNLSITLRNVKAGSDHLESISKNTDDLLKESKDTIKKVNEAVGRSNEVLTNMEQATKPFAQRSESITRNLDEGVIRINKILTQVQDLFETGTKGDGTIQRLLKDPSLYNNLNDAACLITRSLPRLDRIMKDIEVFADKIARHPESLGVGGAVRPSAGLKESPNAPAYWQPK